MVSMTTGADGSPQGRHCMDAWLSGACGHTLHPTTPCPSLLPWGTPCILLNGHGPPPCAGLSTWQRLVQEAKHREVLRFHSETRLCGMGERCYADKLHQ